ncbi:hypothetical protein [Erythrobacter tepidarius]|uniref:hypothetical protein n=1 Tax=Erythrobacter tepidarius TaxID=60454 RepID=UPI000A3803C7|nr:hypothetical protein [Erythrobacter tepidarius]
MASLVIHGPMPERFEHHLREANEALGYYRIDALDQLLAMYREQWPKGLSSTMFREAEIRPLLSEKGLSDPRHAQKATSLRAEFNLLREEFDRQNPEGVSGVRFWASAGRHCDAARQLDQSIVPLAGKWSLPLPDCGQEWCPCNWTWEFDLG